MKKAIALCLALLLALLCGAALADVPGKPDAFAYAYDFDGSVLKQSTISEISEYGAALEEATGAQVIAVVVDFLDGMDPADYATDLINEWGIGSKDEDNGVVILLARGDRKIQIGTGTGVDRKLTGSKCGELIDNNISYFASDRFDSGMKALYIDVCEYMASVEGKTLSVGSSIQSNDAYRQDDDDDGSLFDLILGLIVLYIIVSVVFNALSKGGNGCLKMLFMGWLFNNNNNNHSSRNNRFPPMGGGFGGGSFGGGFSGGSFGSRGFGGGFGSTGRRSSGSRSSGSRSSGNRSSGSRSFGGSRSGGGFRGGGFGGGGSRGGGGGRSF